MCLKIIIPIIVLYICICSMIQRFKCTKMSETELIIHLPKSIMLDFKNCN